MDHYLSAVGQISTVVVRSLEVPRILQEQCILRGQPAKSGFQPLQFALWRILRTNLYM